MLSKNKNFLPTPQEKKHLVYNTPPIITCAENLKINQNILLTTELNALGLLKTYNHLFKCNNKDDIVLFILDEIKTDLTKRKDYNNNKDKYDNQQEFSNMLLYVLTNVCNKQKNNIECIFNIINELSKVIDFNIDSIDSKRYEINDFNSLLKKVYIPEDINIDNYISSTKASSTKASPTKASPTKASPTKASSTKANPTKANSTKASSTKASSTKANPTKANSTKASSTKIKSLKYKRKYLELKQKLNIN